MPSFMLYRVAVWPVFRWHSSVCFVVVIPEYHFGFLILWKRLKAAFSPFGL